jgi:hypothetical protein
MERVLRAAPLQMRVTKQPRSAMLTVALGGAEEVVEKHGN